MGVRLRRLREERGMTQAALARALEISPSYLNQIEQNQRPLTVTVLLKISALFGVDMQRFSDAEETHLVADLRELAPRLLELQPSDEDGGISITEIKELVANMPSVARALVGLHNRWLQANEQLEAVRQRWEDGERGEAELYPLSTPEAHEEVRDYFFAQSNHIAALDDAAEAFAAQVQLPAGAAAVQALVEQLQQRHGVQVAWRKLDVNANVPVRQYDVANKVLNLDAQLSAGRQAFQLATQFALLEVDSLLNSLTRSAPFHDAQSAPLLRIGLANYYAGALLLPYSDFLQNAQRYRYDIEALSQHYGVGFETICHRLSTLQRSHSRGIPFFFIRVDRAGNISKRQSATHFHFSKIGGTCPLWNVYEAFAQPGKIVVQLAAMPDGRRYLWVARTVTSSAKGWGKPGKTFAVALGCDVAHAQDWVYSQGLNLHDPNAAAPIGMGCKVCERQGCRQRAFPPIGKPLHVDENQSMMEPYGARHTR